MDRALSFSPFGRMVGVLDLVSSSHKAPDIDMEARHGDRSCHEVSIWICENVAEAGCNFSILPKESELVPHLQPSKAVNVHSLQVWLVQAYIPLILTHWHHCRLLQYG